MLFRAQVARAVNTGVLDDLGHPEKRVEVIHAAMPCWVTPTSSELQFGGNLVVEIGSHRGLSPFDVSIEPEDRLQVSDRSGLILYFHLRVLGVQLAPRLHKELRLESVS